MIPLNTWKTQLFMYYRSLLEKAYLIIHERFTGDTQKKYKSSHNLDEHTTKTPLKYYSKSLIIVIEQERQTKFG